MKAAIIRNYGPPDMLQLQEVPKPSPIPDEVLVRVRASSVGFGDILIRKFNTISPLNFSMPTPLWLPTRMLFGFRRLKLKVLGGEYAGDVEAVGSEVTQFKAGDAVFGYLGSDMGANAEYICVAHDSKITKMPSNLTYAEAATVPYGGITAFGVLKNISIKPGDKVLIIGASGGIGSKALQVARHMGAEVTGVCGSQRVEMVKALGADHVIDYSKEDFTKGNQSYDLIMDISRNSSFGACKRVMKDGGIYLMTSFKTRHLLQMVWTRFFSRKRVICALSSDSRDDLIRTRDLVEAGVIKSFVDRCFPLEQAAEAHRYMESGQRHGHIVLTL